LRPLDIAFVTIADLPEGGGNTSRLRTLIDALRRAGHRPRVWNQHALGISPPEAQRVRGEIAGAPFEYVLGTTLRDSGVGAAGAKLQAVGAIARRLAAAYRERALDLVWFNCLSFYDVAPLTGLARAFGVPTIQSYEDERYELVSGETLSPARRLFAVNSMLGDLCCARMADALVAISSHLESKYARLVDPSRVHRVPTIIDCEAWRLPQEPPAKTPLILYAGAFGEQDDLEGLVGALALLRAEGQRFRCVMLGAHDRASERVAGVRQDVERRGLGPLVELPGFVPRDAVRAAIADASLLFNVRRDGLWSRSGLSTKLSEYLASERAVVASRVGDVDTYLRDGESALLVPAGASAAQIAAALRRGLASYELRRRIAAAGREVAQRCFDVGVAQKRLAEVLAAATSRRARTRPLLTADAPSRTGPGS
jgi:glycosyltransferase involved in cell wall biosynthesis